MLRKRDWKITFRGGIVHNADPSPCRFKRWERESNAKRKTTGKKPLKEKKHSRKKRDKKKKTKKSDRDQR